MQRLLAKITFDIGELETHTYYELGLEEGSDSDSWTTEQYLSVCEYLNLPQPSDAVDVKDVLGVDNFDKFVVEYDDIDNDYDDVDVGDDNGDGLLDESTLDNITDALSDAYSWCITSIEYSFKNEDNTNAK